MPGRHGAKVDVVHSGWLPPMSTKAVSMPSEPVQRSKSAWSSGVPLYYRERFDLNAVLEAGNPKSSDVQTHLRPSQEGQGLDQRERTIRTGLPTPSKRSTTSAKAGLPEWRLGETVPKDGAITPSFACPTTSYFRHDPTSHHMRIFEWATSQSSSLRRWTLHRRRGRLPPQPNG